MESVITNAYTCYNTCFPDSLQNYSFQLVLSHWFNTTYTLHYIVLRSILTLRSDCQGLTLPPHQTTTVWGHTTYCDVVLIACHETSQFILCDTGSGDVQKSSIWGLGSVGGDVDEVKISSASTIQCPAHSYIHSTTNIFRDVNTGESSDRGGTWKKE